MSAIEECAPSPENCAECPKAATYETALKNLSLDAPDEAPGVSSPEKTAEPEAISPERTGKDKKTRRRRGNKKPDAPPAARRPISSTMRRASFSHGVSPSAKRPHATRPVGRVRRRC